MEEIYKISSSIIKEIAKYNSEYDLLPKMIIGSESLAVGLKLILMQQNGMYFGENKPLLKLYGIDFMTSPRLKDLEFEIY